MSDVGQKDALPQRVLNEEEAKIMIKFPPFYHGEKTYDLSHLDPSVVQFTQPSAPGKPAIVYDVNLIYLQHCFTRDLPRNGEYDKALECRDGREVRLFNADRWELSKRLPGIIRQLAHRPCRFAKNNNFVTVEVIVDKATTLEYDVFFVASKAARPRFINLFIQSAYVREAKQTGQRVGFFPILHGVLNNKKLKP